MAEKTINELTELTSVDRAADYLEIADASDANASKRSSVNSLLNITSQPVGINDSQTLTSKTLTSPTISSPTLSGTVSGTYTLGGTPTFPSSVVTLTGSQTLTNKTLTSPMINTPTITNPTLTADTISEFTSGNGITLDGLNIKDSKLNTNNSVVTANITDSAVTNAKLAANAAWTAWTPTWTNLTVSGSTVTARYSKIGRTVFYRICVVLGGGDAPTGSVTFTLPEESVSYAGTANTHPIGYARYFVTSVYGGAAMWASTTTAVLVVDNTSGTYSNYTTLSATIPGSFTNGSEIHVDGHYEVAS